MPGEGSRFFSPASSARHQLGSVRGRPAASRYRAGHRFACLEEREREKRMGSLSRKGITAGVVALLSCALGVSASFGNVVIREWDVPTPNSRPHDPAVAPDGALWYTGQLANKLGRLDPKTGVIKEFALKTPESGPHGLAADKDGNIWFTANFKAYIGRLDPRTGAVTEYPMPDPRAHDPHTLVFGRDGTIFFTTQESNFVG